MGCKEKLATESMCEVPLSFLLPAPSFREMDCAVFISCLPCASLIISFSFSACDSFPVSCVRILLIVPGKRQTQIPITTEDIYSCHSQVLGVQYVGWEPCLTSHVHRLKTLKSTMPAVLTFIACSPVPMPPGKLYFNISPPLHRLCPSVSALHEFIFP